jgi:glycosyltransferase involved in cell wall biosynthesis
VDLKRSAHNRLHEFVAHLSHKHDVTVLSIRDWWKAQQTDVSQYNHSLEGVWQRVDVQYFVNYKISPIVQELLSVVTIGRILHKLDHFDVHLNYNTLVSGFYTALRLKAKGTGTVYDLADDLPAMIGASPQISPLLRPLGGSFAWLMVRLNLALSEKATLTTPALSLPRAFKDKYVMVPNGVDTTQFSRKDSGELREQLGLKDSFVLGYVGVLREWIDLEPTIMALATLRDEGYKVKLLVVGEEGGLEGPKALVEKYNVSGSVVFTGTVPYEKVPWYISCMDLGLIPFKTNAVTIGALPLKLLEYMACEVPVLASRLPGIEKAVGERILYATTAEEIACAINALQQKDPERWRIESRRFVKETFDLKLVISSLEHVLEKVALTRQKAST